MNISDSAANEMADLIADCAWSRSIVLRCEQPAYAAASETKRITAHSRVAGTIYKIHQHQKICS
jgi:hypothetical protein